MKFGKLLRLGAGLIGVRGVRSTYRPKIGPLTFNTSAQTGLSSISVGAGPLRAKLWDRRGNTGLSSIDLPGPISYRPSHRQKKPTKVQRTGTARAPVTMNPNGLDRG